MGFVLPPALARVDASDAGPTRARRDWNQAMRYAARGGVNIGGRATLILVALQAAGR